MISDLEMKTQQLRIQLTIRVFRAVSIGRSYQEVNKRKHEESIHDVKVSNILNLCQESSIISVIEIPTSMTHTSLHLTRSTLHTQVFLYDTEQKRHKGGT